MCGCVGVSLCINENMDPRGYLYSTSQLNLTFFAVHEFQKEQLSSLITSLSLSAFFFPWRHVKQCSQYISSSESPNVMATCVGLLHWPDNFSLPPYAC